MWRNGDLVGVSPKAIEVLAVLIENRGDLVKRDVILDRVWQDTFVEDGNLNHAILTLRKALGDNVIQTVPRRGYRFVAPLTPIVDDRHDAIVIERRTSTNTFIEENETDTNVERPQLTSGTGKRFGRPLIFLSVALLLACAAVVWFAVKGRGVTRTAPLTSIKKIAFLPLKIVGNVNANNDDPIASGIVENLAARLGGLRNLTVLSTRSSARLAETESDPVAIGTRLGADAVVEGSYQAAGGRVHMNVRMLNVSDGSQIWSGSFDETLDDVLKLQDKLASAAANGLSGRLTSEEQKMIERRATNDVEAYKLYLRGRHEWGKRTDTGLKQSVAAFRQAIDRDPSYSLAYAGLADSYAIFADYNIERPVDAFPKAKAAALKALELDPESARPRVALAYILATFDWDYAEAERQYKMAIEAEPNYGTAHQWYGEMLYALHRYDEAVKELDKAVELDPLVPITLSERAVLHYYKGDLDEALTRFSALKADHPDFPTSYIFSAWIYGLKGDTKNAFENELTFWKLQGADPVSLSEMSDAFARGGHQAFLTKVAERNVAEVQKGAFPAYKVAHTFARLRNREQTLYWIDKCIEERSPNIIKIYSDKNFDFLRDDPRFKDAVDKLKLVQPI
ncbi:MAG: winged helix-turn-helix domain-containing protein [Pyrinomonadaceae bacterium]